MKKIFGQKENNPTQKHRDAYRTFWLVTNELKLLLLSTLLCELIYDLQDDELRLSQQRMVVVVVIFRKLKSSFIKV